jgi:hypothetical protein
MRVPAIVLMGLVLSGCVSSREPPSQPVPPANLGATQAAPPVPPAPLPAGLPLLMADSRSPPGPISRPTEQAGSSFPMERDAFRTVHGATSAPETSLFGQLSPSTQMSSC